jgi:hypothetical protein
MSPTIWTSCSPSGRATRKQLLPSITSARRRTQHTGEGAGWYFVLWRGGLEGKGVCVGGSQSENCRHMTQPPAPSECLERVPVPCALLCYACLQVGPVCWPPAGNLLEDVSFISSNAYLCVPCCAVCVARWDLCAGPHVETTGSINPAAFELEAVAGAYWRGDEKNAMLQVCRGYCCWGSQ